MVGCVVPSVACIALENVIDVRNQPFDPIQQVEGRRHEQQPPCGYMAAQQRGSYMEEKPQYDAGGETFPILPDMNPLMPFHFFRQCGVLGQHDAEEHAGFERAEQQALCEFGIVIDFHSDRLFVLENYQHVNDVSDFALLAHMSVRNFQRKFKEEFKWPVREWLNERRAERILRDIRNTDKSIAEIATSYGFATASYFTVFCKQYFGMTPSELRRRSKQTATKCRE